MLGFFVRILLVAAAPIAALFLARDSLNFGIIQVLISIILIVACIGLASAWGLRRARTPS